MKNTSQTAKRTLSEQDKDLMGKIIDFFSLSYPRTLVVRLFSLALLVAKVESGSISDLTGYCSKSISKLRKVIDEGRELELFSINGGGRPSTLSQKGLENEVVSILEKENFHTHQQIVDMIKERFGIKISLSAAGRLLKKHGFKKRKCGSLPAKADAEAQRSFYETVLLPLMKRAEEAKNEVLLFADAAHCVIGCDFLGSVYSRTRRFMRTFSGRQRHNILGAIDFVTKKMIVVENDTSINRDSFRELLVKLSTEYPGKIIHIVLDNAKYQRCSEVTELAKALGIDLVFLPPYSPNLNLIERVWRFVKSELRTKYYSNFDEFKNRISEIIASMETINHGKICKLIGEKVQLYDGLEQIDCHTLVLPKKVA